MSTYDFENDPNLTYRQKQMRRYYRADKKRCYELAVKWRKAHPEEWRKSQKRYKDRNRELVHTKNREYRRNNKDVRAKWKSNNKNLMKEYSRLRAARIKTEVITAYGGKCNCCNEDRIEFLCLDHINNDGKNHRKEMGSGSVFYGRLRKAGFPQGRLQALCFNCNMAKQFYGSCPHVNDQLPK